jgi:hypothetical protein
VAQALLMSARRGAAGAALCALLASPAAAFPLLYDGNGGALLTTALGANLSLTPSEGGARPPPRAAPRAARPCLRLHALR